MVDIQWMLRSYNKDPVDGSLQYPRPARTPAERDHYRRLLLDRLERYYNERPAGSDLDSSNPQRHYCKLSIYAVIAYLHAVDGSLEATAGLRMILGDLQALELGDQSDLLKPDATEAGRPARQLQDNGCKVNICLAIAVLTENGGSQLQPAFRYVGQVLQRICDEYPQLQQIPALGSFWSRPDEGWRSIKNIRDQTPTQSFTRTSRTGVPRSVPDRAGILRASGWTTGPRPEHRRASRGGGTPPTVIRTTQTAR